MNIALRSCCAVGVICWLACFTVARPAHADSGPDVQYTDCQSLSHYGAVGSIRGYALGSHTCNIGNQNLLWTNNGTPGLAMNAYRLHAGRLEQIGMSWVKTACCAAAGNGCGMSCNGVGGNLLGAGCLDVYSSGWNGGQSRLAPRSVINAYTGVIGPFAGSSGDAIYRRLQIQQSDLTAANFPGALYFVEGEYAATDDAAAGNAMNNASYKRVTVNGDFSLSLTGAMQVGMPAIFAWRAHGLGLNVPDPRVNISPVDVPGEGRFYLAAKVTDLGGQRWRYDYSLFNFNSHRSGGSFSVPVDAGAAVSNVGYHDVPYHSGEPYNNADWPAVVGSSSVTWSSPETFAQNPNSNALRWATMYNYWFEAGSAPTNGTVTIGLFRPGTPDAVTAAAEVPSPTTLCTTMADVNGDGFVNGEDVFGFVDCYLSPGKGQFLCACADMNNNGQLEPNDITLFTAALVAP